MISTDANCINPSAKELITVDPRVKSGEIRRKLEFISFLLAEVPADAVGPALVWRDQKDNQVHWRSLEGISTTIGRSTRCNFVLDATSVSRIHAEIRRESDGWEIKDLNSSNGTFVDGLRITERKLNGCVVIQVGRVSVLFFAPDELEAEF